MNQVLSLVWIGGWTLTTWVYLQARKRYGAGNRRHKDSGLMMSLDSFGINPALSLLIFLLLWPILLVGFIGYIILAFAERKLEEAEDEMESEED